MWFLKASWVGYSFRMDHVFMRSSGDKRPDTQVKADILKFIPKDKVVLVIDDRPSVCRMWRENGLRDGRSGWQDSLCFRVVSSQRDFGLTIPDDHFIKRGNVDDLDKLLNFLEVHDCGLKILRAIR